MNGLNRIILQMGKTGILEEKNKSHRGTFVQNVVESS